LNALLINNNYLSDIGVYLLAKILSANNNNNLKILNLGSNGITDEGIKHLSHMLKTNKVLTDLYLSENNISDEGVQILANVIQNNKTTIEKLSLCGNKLLTDSSVIYLIQMIEKSSSLKQLSITDCDFSDKKKTKLIKAQQSKGNFDLSV
jgi:Ran GTPase-activating protein (RanGAP) involved in mRNA processing and transport